MSNTVAEVSTWSNEHLKEYIRDRLPKDDHFFATREQLVLIVVKLMDVAGKLSDADSKIINTPGFDRIFVLEDGDISRSIIHLGIDTSLNSVNMLL